ncbi:MAG TPA: glycosyltransferase [Acetobacteraceae bacterium]|nr:glycosyltransferase [Acetobacteraceae bacterium]
MDTPRLTVCICTHNRPAYLRACLDGLRRQSVRPDRFEVLIVDSGSTPEVAREIERLAMTAPNIRHLRVARPGVSLARNVGARCARSEWIAYIDDDAIPEPGWVRAILDAIAEPSAPALVGGRILPSWEAPLPRWWPARLRGVLSIIEHDWPGEYRTKDVPRGLEPYAANMVVNVAALLEAGGFRAAVGRYGAALLSDEEVQLAWTLQDSGRAVRYDPRVVVRHQIAADRLTPEWLLRRLYWQGASAVVTRRLLGEQGAVWRALPRRLLVAALFAPAALIPPTSAVLIGLRWRRAYSAGFIRAALGWQAAAAAERLARRAPASNLAPGEAQIAI